MIFLISMSFGLLEKVTEVFKKAGVLIVWDSTTETCFFSVMVWYCDAIFVLIQIYKIEYQGLKQYI